MTISSVYLHVPFCEAKCPYCAFASSVRRDGDEEVYLRAITKEMIFRRGAHSASALTGGPVQTLYIGGGTPTVLSIDAWRVLTRMIESAFSFSDGAEVTVEANPGSLSLDHLRLWLDWRVTRISVGVQSFDDAELALLGRVHNRAQAMDAVAACRSAGFSVSLDLMFGLPGQDFRNWARTLKEALSLSPHHISIYQLSIEPGTPFEEGNFDLSDGYAPYRYAQWLLPRRGYAQYEVASFARSGHESRHNLNYWDDGEYLGLGPAAWGCVAGVRRRNEPDLARYADFVERQGSAAVYEERLEGEAAARQAAVLALRTKNGIGWGYFSKRYGGKISAAIREELMQFPEDLVRCDELGASLTPRGLRVANRIWEELI